MSFEKAKTYLDQKGYGSHVLVLNESSATVDLAAAAVGTTPEKIAKSLTFMVDDSPVMIVTGGDAKIDNRKYKDYFHKKAKMMTSQEVHDLIGHDIGGVCPFGINKNVRVYLDVSLQRFETVYPACGDDHSTVKLTIAELEEVSNYSDWIDVCKVSER